MSARFEVDDEHELRALHRALFEAKFHADPEDRDVPASPFVADLSRRVVDTLAALKPEEDWASWRQAEHHRSHFPVVVSHIAAAKAWPRWAMEQKRDYVCLLLAPLEADESVVSELIESGDQAHRAA